MSVKGSIFEWEGTGAHYQITGAAISDNRISIDWNEEGERGHLEADSADGVHFRGSYGYTQPDPDYSFELRRFTSGQDVLLFGTWFNRKSGEEGGWVLLLTGAANPVRSKK
jgi:hypothetical protein